MRWIAATVLTVSLAVGGLGAVVGYRMGTEAPQPAITTPTVTKTLTRYRKCPRGTTLQGKTCIRIKTR